MALKLERYPKTTNKSLKAFSNAEVLALDFIKEKQCQKIHLFNDRFGFWNCSIQNKKVVSIFCYASQKKAVIQNLERNNLTSNIDFKTPLDQLQEVELALIKIPKSLELFELFLQQIHKASTEKTEIVCCFMTKYFSKSFLKISEKYFEKIEQSKAWKKARLLILKTPKKIHNYKKLINEIEYKSDVIKQHYGVFSSSKIDIGTQFLLENIDLNSNEKTVLDLASGNGIIAKVLSKKYTDIQLHLVDDFNLAIASSKLNIEKATFFWNDTLDFAQNNYFDLVVSNPPFHFEYENNIEVSLSLFKDVKRVLKNGGRFVLVANKHLNYKTHLENLFKVSIVSENERFVVYSCVK